MVGEMRDRGPVSPQTEALAAANLVMQECQRQLGNEERMAQLDAELYKDLLPDLIRRLRNPQANTTDSQFRGIVSRSIERLSSLSLNPAEALLLRALRRVAEKFPT